MSQGVAHRVVEDAWVRRPWAGLAFVLVVGSLWHFTYDLLARFWLIGLIAPVNESVWEHTKLIAIPMLLWAVVIGWRTAQMPGALVAGVVAGAAGAGLMAVGYYAYVAVLGAGAFPMDIGLFVLCALAALALFGRLRVRPAAPWAAGAAVAVELAVFAVLTIAPPDLPMFIPQQR